MIRNLIISALLLTSFQLNAQQYSVEIIETNVNTSIRGLFALNDSTIWASGSNGYIGKSTNGGKTWAFNQIAGYDSAEFRDIEVFDEQTILVMSSVMPACILKSTDAGNTWKEVFRDDRPEAFLDAIDFFGKKGICLGDPIKNEFILLKTNNKGDSWTSIKGCLANDSIAPFAASGTTIKLIDKKTVYFAAGGNQSLLYTSTDFGKSWTSTKVPMQQGAQSKGIFSIDFIDENIGAAAGGDYLNPGDYTGSFTMLVKDKDTWKMPLTTNPNGYRSCIQFIDPFTLISCGTNGVDIAHQFNWTNISIENFNTIAVTANRNVFLAGNKGRIGIVKVKSN
jgi:photosystem II stability/assembly factor-like uncharacterized protein